MRYIVPKLLLPCKEPSPVCANSLHVLTYDSSILFIKVINWWLCVFSLLWCVLMLDNSTTTNYLPCTLLRVRGLRQSLTSRPSFTSKKEIQSINESLWASVSSSIRCGAGSHPLQNWLHINYLEHISVGWFHNSQLFKNSVMHLEVV